MLANFSAITLGFVLDKSKNSSMSNSKCLLDLQVEASSHVFQVVLQNCHDRSKATLPLATPVGHHNAAASVSVHSVYSLSLYTNGN